MPRKSFPTIVKTFGDRIQVKRAEQGLDAGELALQLGVPKSTVARWEADLEVPDATQRRILEGLLRFDLP